MSFPYLFPLFSHSAHLSLNKDLAEQIENFGSSSNKCMCIFICDVLLPSSYSHHTYDVSFASKPFVISLFMASLSIHMFLFMRYEINDCVYSIVDENICFNS